MNSIIDLKNFWKELKDKSDIKFKDIDKLEELLGKVFLSFSELEKSRNKWRARALKR